MSVVPKLNLGNVTSGGGWALGERPALIAPAAQQKPNEVFRIAGGAATVAAGPGHSSDDERDDAAAAAPPPAAAAATDDTTDIESPPTAAAPPPQLGARPGSRSTNTGTPVPADASGRTATPGAAGTANSGTAPPSESPATQDVDAASATSTDDTFLVDNRPAGRAAATAAAPADAAASRTPTPATPPPGATPVRDGPDDDGVGEPVSANRRWAPAEIVSTKEFEMPVRAVEIVNSKVWCAAGDDPVKCFGLDGRDLSAQQVISDVVQVRSICFVPAAAAPASGSTSASPAKGDGGDMLWCGTDHGQIDIISLFFNRKDTSLPAAHSDQAVAHLVHANGKVFSAGKDKVIRAWDVYTRRPIGAFRKTCSEWTRVLTCAVASTNQLWTVGGKVLRLWDMSDYNEVMPRSYRLHNAQNVIIQSKQATGPEPHITAKHEVLSLAYHPATSAVWVSMFERLVVFSTRLTNSSSADAGGSGTLSATSSFQGIGTATTTATTHLTVVHDLDLTAPNVEFVGDRLAVVIGRGGFIGYTSRTHDCVAVLRLGATASAPLELVHRGSIIDGVSAVGCHALGGESPFAVVAHTTHRGTRCLSVLTTEAMDPVGSWGITGHDDAVLSDTPLQQQQLAAAREHSHPATSGHTTPRGGSTATPAGNPAAKPATSGSAKLSKQPSSNAPPSGDRSASSQARLSTTTPSASGGDEATATSAQAPVADTIDDVDDTGSNDSFVVHDQPIDLAAVRASPPKPLSSSQTSPIQQRTSSGGAARLSSSAASSQPEQDAASGQPAVRRGASDTTSADVSPPPGAAAASPATDGPAGSSSAAGGARPSGTAAALPPRPAAAGSSLSPARREHESSASSSQVVSASTRAATSTVNIGGATNRTTGRDALPSGVAAGLGGTNAIDPTILQRLERKAEAQLGQLRRVRISSERQDDFLTLLNDALKMCRDLELTVVRADETQVQATPGLPILPPQVEAEIDQRFLSSEGRTVAIVMAAMQEEVYEMRGLVMERDEVNEQLMRDNAALQKQVEKLNAAIAAGGTGKRGHVTTASGQLAPASLLPSPSAAAGEAAMTPPAVGPTSSIALGASAADMPVDDAAAAMGMSAGEDVSAATFVHALEANRRADRASFQEQLRALQRQHEGALAKLHALTHGWARVLSTLELATARDPPPLVLSAAAQISQPPSAVVADLFASDSNLFLTPASTTQSINLAMHSVSGLLRSHILRPAAAPAALSAAQQPSASAGHTRVQSSLVGAGSRGPTPPAAPAPAAVPRVHPVDPDRLSDILDRLEAGNTARTQRSADDVDGGSHRQSAPPAPAYVGTSGEDVLPWAVGVDLAIRRLDEAYSFGLRIPERVSYLKSLTAASGLPDVPLEASGVLLLQAELFSELCAHEAVLLIANVTAGECWPSEAERVLVEGRPDSAFWSRFHLANNAVDDHGNDARKELSIAKTHALVTPTPSEVSNDALDGRSAGNSPVAAVLSQSNTELLELRRLLATCSLPVGERAFVGFVRWCALWTVCFAYQLAQVVQLTEAGQIETARRDAQAVSLRFAGMSALQSHLRFFMELFEPVVALGGFSTKPSNSDGADTLDLEESDDDEDAELRRHERAAAERAAMNPFALWMQTEPEDILGGGGDDPKKDSVEILAMCDAGQIEPDLEALVHALDQLRHCAREAVQLAKLAPSPLDQPSEEFTSRITTTKRNIAALQVLTKRLNARKNAAQQPPSAWVDSSPVAASITPHVVEADEPSRPPVAAADTDSPRPPSAGPAAAEGSFGDTASVQPAKASPTPPGSAASGAETPPALPVVAAAPQSDGDRDEGGRTSDDESPTDGGPVHFALLKN